MTIRTRLFLMTALLLLGTLLWLPGLRSRRVAAQSPALAGSYSFSASGTVLDGAGSPIEVIGVMTLDGAGNMTGSETVVQSDNSAKPPGLQAFAIGISGTYSVKPDGSGTMNIAVQIPDAPPAATAFVLTDGGAGFLFTQTSGSVLLHGTGRKQ